MTVLPKLDRPRALFFLLVILSIPLFSYRLTSVPPGLTVDEAAFGYNAALLSKTGFDQNGRFLPFFVLSIEGRDWRQPVTQYFITLFFKIFGANYFNLRFTSVIIVLVSLVLLLYLSFRLEGKLMAFLTGFLFLTTPIIMIHSHLALDNLMPVFFTILWLLLIFLYQKNRRVKYLLFAGFSLGICFYTYKAMRAIVPVWCLLTTAFLFYDSASRFKKKLVGNFSKTIRPSLLFSLAILPFFAVIPILEKKYAGAVFDGQGLNWSSFYDFLYPYLSSFDLSFLFIKGDTTVYHSTGRHGMFLLASLPFFLLGCFRVFTSKKSFWYFVLVSFFSAPILFGLVNSVHRASRLISLVPAYVLLSGFGGVGLLGNRNCILNSLFCLTVLAAVFNYSDFLKYYWFSYPKVAEEWFSKNTNDDYLALSERSKETGVLPYIDETIYLADGENAHFFEAAYFDKPISRWVDGRQVPENSLLMSQRKEVPGFKNLNLNLPYYYLLIPEQK
ncbi:MAG: glycosyltransferase family 39 protein [Patescibacteria group bacterium]|nr:glycosyltransferase family 39 protein [Patescibacteria group bacterium]